MEDFVRLRAMPSHVETSYLLDIFDVEGMLFENSYGYRVGIVGVLSCQLPHLLGWLVHSNT